METNSAGKYYHWICSALSPACTIFLQCSELNVNEWNFNNMEISTFNIDSGF